MDHSTSPSTTSIGSPSQRLIGLSDSAVQAQVVPPRSERLRSGVLSLNLRRITTPSFPDVSRNMNEYTLRTPLTLGVSAAFTLNSSGVAAATMAPPIQPRKLRLVSF